MADLTTISDNLEFFTRVAVDGLRSGTAANGGKALTTIGVYHRARGIARFLQYHDRRGFVMSAGRAVQARLAYLRELRVDDPRRPPRYSTTAQNRALYDAIVVGDDASATELAARGRGRWNGDHEYEDDFLFHEFFHAYWLDGPGGRTNGNAASMRALLDRFVEVAGKPDIPEIVVCRALLSGDAEALDIGLRGLIVARDKAFAEEPTTPPELSGTERHVFVHGLAIVLLARRRGIYTADEYPTIPEALLTLGASTPLASDSWLQVD